ncbi:hypothetical protein ACSSS7_006448 [Eimeria intestinalis]
MAKLSASLALVACGLQFGALIGGSGVHGDIQVVGTLTDALNAVFNQIVEEAERDFTRADAPLQACGPHGPSGQRECRRVLKNEPDEAHELLPFLLKDTEAMKLWRQHFHRHVSTVVKEAGEESGSEGPLHVPVLKTLAESEFWTSRPAVSSGALEHLQQKMNRMRAEATKRGLGAERAVTWEAEVSPRFKYHSIKDAKRLMGTYLDSYIDPEKPAVAMGEPLPPKVFANLKPVDQKNFDAREAFPQCKDVIGHVRDQGDCGSCWAFASTEALNDRFCIKTNGEKKEMLSTQHTTSCCDLLHCLSFACNGGQPRMAWRWFSNQGVVTGGDYSELHQGKSCWPYEIPFCQHHSDGPYPECQGPLPKAPKCRKDCEEVDYTKTVHAFSDDLHYATASYSVQGRDQIKQELMDHGSLSGAFLVFEDFLMYKNGVYHHVSGGPLGGHAIKVIGFGNQDDKDYWLAVNSWNEYWGDKGTFKIEMGEAGIDHEFCGGEAKVPDSDTRFLQQATQDL